MKRKFFTLLTAAAFLLGTSVTAFASVPHTPFTGGMVGNNASNLVKGANAGLYHITNVDPSTGDPVGVLYVDNSNTTTAGTVTIEDPTTSENLLGQSLWCVEISTEAQGKNPSFTFLNKAYGDNLRANATAVSSLVLDGPLTDWKFSDVYGAGVALDVIQPLYSYIDGSRAIVLVDNGASGVKTVIANVADIEEAAKTNATALGSETLLYFTLSEAAPIVLTAADFNTKLGTEPTATGQKLTFAPDKNVGVNPFSENVLSATDVTTGATGADRYLNLKKGSQFLRVDTSLVNATGSYFLNFKFTNTIEAGIVDQYAFRFVYFPSHDSLIINVKSALQPSKSQEALGLKYFNEYVGMNSALHGANEGELVSQDDVYTHNSLIDFTYIILQDLNQNKVVTVGELPSQTRISLGLGGCKAAVNKTSLQGLYTIQNKEGKYLQVPIYTDSVALAAKWVTVEKYVDVNEMPSFQWVVEKIRSNDPDNTSQIKITNREYEDVELGTIQLWSDKENTLANAAIAAGTAAFTEVGEKYRLDPYLGYKYVAADIAKLRTYTFNYLNELNDTKYLSVKNDQNDSLLHVTDAQDAFALVPYHHYVDNKLTVEPVNYGYTGSIKKIAGKAYAADLVRTAYILKVKEGNKIFNTNKVVVVDKEGRYAVSSGDGGKNYIAAGDSAVFYLKTNNTKEGKNYYALVDTSSFTNALTPEMITVKAGVADHNLWVKAQNHYEIRTSAFAVEQNEAPLYRRLNRTTDGAIGSDSFYNGPAGSDNPDTLRFFRMNNPNEFLYEDANSVYSKGKGINFLGVRHKTELEGDVESRTAMYVDTAFVARPAIKGAIEDTPKPQYLIGVGVYNVEGTTTEIPCEPSVTTPFYKRGRYLINATDSVYGVGANWAGNWQPAPAVNVVKNSNYIWDTKWERLAFVDAVVLYDTMYVLNGQTYADPIDFNKLTKDAKVRAIRLDNNLHKDVVFSFRLIDDEKDVAYADQVQNFLIESETTNRGEQEMIAPMNGGWVKIQNGVPVISRGAYADAITDAERFNVVKTDANPVSNETVNVADFKVVAGEGNVTILNAAGKNVVVSNILGQVVANEVLGSDNVSIAAPKGIVVVAVEGESAVKAIIK